MKNKRSFRRRIMPAVLAVMLAVSGCTLQKSADDRQATETVSNEIPPEKEDPQAKIPAETPLPSAYRYGEKELPHIRDQQNTNKCWAYASLSALESSKDEDAGEVYSAEHLLVNNPFRTAEERGGNHVMAMAYLLSWTGPVRECDAHDLAGAAACVHVQEVRMGKEKDYGQLKRFVWQYGGVETEIYADANGNLADSSYYNAENASYCYRGEEKSNHAVVVIGWDDDYPAENFAGNVENDGAFLCRNSWGERFGEDGNFYISYEDDRIGEDFIVYSRVDEADYYDCIYQSDLCGYTAQLGYGQEECWFANVYRADWDISVRAAGFYATDRNTEYEIFIVPDFQGEASLKEREYVTEGFLTDAGYYTADFPKAVDVEAGNEFAVIVRICTEDARYPAAAELPKAAEGGITDGQENPVDLSDGKGYLSLRGNVWENAEKTNGCNICLKAYADLR